MALDDDFRLLADRHGATITSLDRTPERNRAVGGVTNSRHLTGNAADYVVPQRNKSAFLQEVSSKGYKAIDEGDHIHVQTIGEGMASLPPGFQLVEDQPAVSGELPAGFQLEDESQVMPEQPSIGLKDYFSAVPETALQLGTGAIAAPLAGIAGLATANPENVGRVQNALTFQPRTQGGQALSGAIAYPFEKMAQGADWVGQQVADVTGSPAVGAAVNTGLQALPMLATRQGGAGMRNRLATRQAELDTARTANAVSDAARTDILNAGYVTPPTQVRPTVARGAVETMAGKGQLKTEAIVRNQERTNSLVREDLGIAPDEPLSRGVLEHHRNLHGQAYEAVRNVRQTLITNPAYRNAIAGLNRSESLLRNNDAAMTQLQQTLRATQNGRMTTGQALDTVRDLRFQATENLKAQGAPERVQLGHAQREAANALDDLIEDNLVQRFGQARITQDYRNARREIAKSHDVEAALNETTGNVDAAHFATLLKKDKPLTGPLRVVGEFGRMFPQIAKMPEKTAAAGVSLGDVAVGGLLGSATGGAGLAAMIARPGMRNALLSRVLQNRIQRPSDYQVGRTQRALTATVGNPSAPYVVGGQQAGSSNRLREEIPR